MTISLLAASAFVADHPKMALLEGPSEEEQVRARNSPPQILVQEAEGWTFRTPGASDRPRGPDRAQRDFARENGPQKGKIEIAFQLELEEPPRHRLA